jgi:hypothetical protein
MPVFIQQGSERIRICNTAAGRKVRRKRGDETYGGMSAVIESLVAET